MSEDSPECRRCREQWRLLNEAGISVASLQAFYARYKYLMMSRDIDLYRALGAALATADQENVAAVAEHVFASMMRALAQTPARGGNVNALLHICGYLKKQLSAEEKRVLLDTIENYRRGDIEIDVPIAALRAHFARFPHPYIQQQWFLQPLPPASNTESLPHDTLSSAAKSQPDDTH